jgi:hypothetical protein
MLRSVKNADTRVYEEVKSGRRSINSAYAELERKYLVPQRKPSGHRKKPRKPGDYVNIAPAGDDRPGYVLGIARDAAAWLATDMLPAPQVVEQRILDMDPEDAREAGDGVVAVADYFSAIAQMYQADAGDPVDAPLVVEATPVLAPPPGPRNLVLEWVAQQQAIAGGEAMTVDAMVAAVAAQPDGISTIRMALATVATTLQDVIRALAKL